MLFIKKILEKKFLVLLSVSFFIAVCFLSINSGIYRSLSDWGINITEAYYNGQNVENYDFYIADAEDSPCLKGNKRCLGDIPQRCDTSGEDDNSLDWHDVFRDGQGCSELGKTCLNGECVSDQLIEMFTQPQPENININFNKGGVKSGTIKAEHVIDKWERFNLDNNTDWDNHPRSNYHAPDFYYDPDRTDEYVATSSHKVWVADNLGPSVAHCPNINNGKNYSRQTSLPANGTYESCGYTFGPSDYPRIDYGQNCHRDRWQAWGDNSVVNYSSFDSYNLSWSFPTDPSIDIGTAYKDCLYNNYNGDDFDHIAENANCDPYNGNTVNLDCEDISKSAVEEDYSKNIPPVHPNECIPGPYGNGVWDWYNQRASCTYFKPGQFKRERICLEKWPDCVPLNKGECPDFKCGGGNANIGNCIYRETNNPCYCPNPKGSPPKDSKGWYKKGSCGWSKGRSVVGNLAEQWCERCNEAVNYQTCNNYWSSSYGVYSKNKCTNYECSFTNPNECNCEWNNCQKGYKPCTLYNCVEYNCIEYNCVEYDEESNCIERGDTCIKWGDTCIERGDTCIEWGDKIWIDMSCESNITVPEDYTYHEAEDCCKRWYWRCSAGCVSQTEDCYEGKAVGWRPDYKYATFTIGGSNGGCGVSADLQFIIKLFVNKQSSPKELEILIKNVNDGLYSPHTEYTETEFDGKVEQGCYRTSVRSIKDIILKSGRLISADDVSDADVRTFDFEDYLSNHGGKYISSIEFKQARE